MPRRTESWSEVGRLLQVSDQRPHLALVGMMGSGKSTLGRRAAAELGRGFVDLDIEIEDRERTTIPDLFERGESVFRYAETSALAAVLARSEPLVIATGGGVVTVAENRRLLMERAYTVWLSAAPGVLAERVGDGEGRPLLDGDPHERLVTLLRDRQDLYRMAADQVLEVDSIEIDDALAALRAMAGSGT